VTLTVVTPKDRRFVSLVDPIPAGFEVIHTDFATESQSLRALLDQYSSRGGWWTFGHFETYG